MVKSKGLENISLTSYDDLFSTGPQTDAGKQVREIPFVGCWAHARRKFDEAVNALPKAEQELSAAVEGQRYCSCLK